MLVVQSNKIFAVLSAFAPLVALLTNGVQSIRPLIAEAIDGDNFVVYYIQYNGKYSKDNATEFTVIVHSYSRDYNTSIAIADQVEKALENAENIYYYKSAQPRFAEENMVFTEQIINIK